MLITLIVVYLLANVAIGYWASRRVHSAKDFVVAGRRLPLIVAASALFATWFGSETILGASSEFLEHGLLGVMEDPFGAALCLLLVGVFFARPLYRMNILTFNDFFRIRFSSRVELISAIVTVPSYLGWIAAQLVALAIILNVLIGLPLMWGIVVCTVIVTVYTYVGGMWAVSITDFVQTIMIIVGLLILALQLNGQVGGFTKVMDAVPAGTFQFFPDLELESILTYIAAWITIGLGSIPGQDVFQRTMSAKDENTAVRAAYLGSAMYIVIGSLPLFIALCGRILYPELLDVSEDPQMLLPNIVLRHGNMLIQILFFGALLSAILSTTSGAILAPATVIGENILKPRFPHWEDRQLLAAMRWAVVGVAVASAIMAFRESSIYELVAQASSVSLVSLFVPLTAGLYWNRANATGALAAIVVGMVVWIYFELFPGPVPSILYGLLASAVGMVVGSFLPQTPKAPTKV